MEKILSPSGYCLVSVRHFIETCALPQGRTKSVSWFIFNKADILKQALQLSEFRGSQETQVPSLCLCGHKKVT